MATERKADPQVRKLTRCEHDQLDGDCTVAGCRHWTCPHGGRSNCLECRRERRQGKPRWQVLEELDEVPSQLEAEAAREAKRQAHRARFQCEPVVCVWGEP